MAKKRGTRKAAKAMLIGSQFFWDCRDPLEPKSEILNTRLSHKNPIKRLMLERQPGLLNGLTDRLSLKWKINVEIEYQDQHGKQYFRAIDLVIQGVLREADGHYQQAIEEVFAVSNMRHYVTCHMSAEVIGLDAIKESDFDEVA